MYQYGIGLAGANRCINKREIAMNYSAEAA